MRINTVTLTGADDNTKVEDLKSLQKEFPFVEWGILFSASKTGSNRYPSMSWIDQLLENKYEDKHNKLRLSGHFCGQYAKQVMAGKFPELDKLTGAFRRFQINYNFSTTPGYDLEALKKGMLKRYEEAIFILQYNKANKEVIDDIIINYSASNLHCLYDSSGGRGKEITEIKKDLSVYTGYSGGLNPDNVEEVCKKIHDCEPSVPVWIDAETGVRTNDKFDLDKVRKFLEVCKKYVYEV